MIELKINPRQLAKSNCYFNGENEYGKEKENLC